MVSFFSNNFSRTSLFALSAALVLPQAGYAGNDDDNDTVTKTPKVYAVLQQQGPVCPFIPWVNLKKVRKIRARGRGAISLQSSDFKTKIQGYAEFQPLIRILDDSYDVLRSNHEGEFSKYESRIETDGVKSGEIKHPSRWMPLSPAAKSRRDSFTPFNLNTGNDAIPCFRILPIVQKGGSLYFYNHTENTAEKLESADDYLSKNFIMLVTYGAKNVSDYKPYSLSDKQAGLLGGPLDTVRVTYTTNYLGFDAVMLQLNSADVKYQREFYSDAGTYQHMLFACGLGRDNNDLIQGDEDYPAYQEFHAEMSSNPLNPWSAIKKEDLFEWQLARVFQSNSKLKSKAISAAEFSNTPWKYYQESMKATVADGKTLAQKQRYLPGEDQMLAYFLSFQLRFLWASTVSTDALFAIEELEDELGTFATGMIKNAGFLPGVPTTSKIISSAKKSGFVDVWQDVKNEILQFTNGVCDFVTFTGHGCVISLDDELVKSQPHEDKETATALGVEMWEQLYDKGFTGLHYQRPGTDRDLIKFVDSGDTAIEDSKEKSDE